MSWACRIVRGTEWTGVRLQGTPRLSVLRSVVEVDIGIQTATAPQR
jgi:hypothetical protein